jgi:hypothetical protein
MVTGGSNQSTLINTAFANQLQVIVYDSASKPVSNTLVTFTAPSTGPSGTFNNNSSIVFSGTTDVNGVVNAGVFTANALVGTYTVSAAAAGVATPANFSLTNTAPPVVGATSIAVSGGSGQSTPISTTFTIPLAAIVRDNNNSPLPGVLVTFSAPTSGASGSFPGGVASVTALTNSSGIATANSFTANGSVGSYSVVATTSGVAGQAVFNLINTPLNTASGYTYYLPFLANNANNFTTYLVFQNPNPISTTINLRYYDTVGGVVTVPAATCSYVVAYAECIAPNPFALNTPGEGVLISSQPLNVVVAEATPYGGSAYVVAAGASNTLIAPVAIRGGLVDFTTQLSIFNGGSSPVTGTVSFYSADGTHLSAADKAFSLGANTPLSYDQFSDNSLGNNFYGWAEVSSASGSQLVAQILEQRPATHFVAIANAQQQASSTLYAPAVLNGAFGSFVTGANFVNPSSVPVTVSVNYYDHTGTLVSAAPFVVAAKGVVGVYDGASGGGTGLPSGGLASGYYGAASISSSGGGVVMLVNEQGGTTSSGTSQSGTYAAASTGNTSVGLPVLANGAYGGYITGATILNTTNSSVTAKVQYYSLDGNAVGTSSNMSIGAHASGGLYQGDSGQGLAGGFYGTAVVSVVGGPTSSLIVTTNAQSDQFFYTYTEPNQ